MASEPPPRRTEAAETDALIDRTLEVWQPLSGRPLTREDARQIAENLTGFFGILLRWHDNEAGSAVAEASEDRLAA